MKTPRPRPRSRLFPTPDDAENAFYEALERGDLAAMVAVWAEADDVVCVHPRGPRLVGFDAVRQSWAQIFAGAAQLRVATTAVQRFDGPTVAVHSLVETVGPASGGASASVHATNVYELTDGGWRMVVHHASPIPEAEAPEEPPEPAHTLH
ncbi:MAG TPA: nuclear transport factor 2 family protein [Usitatibacter sp.]|jgi:uncharacterized protein (TIGR02246 family)